MVVITYNKLVRDRIPEVIEKNGKQCSVRTLNDDEYIKMLNAKLGEELKEYLESGDIEELADLLEVAYTVAETKGYNRDELEAMRFNKRAKNGGFKVSVKPSTPSPHARIAG